MAQDRRFDRWICVKHPGIHNRFGVGKNSVRLNPVGSVLMAMYGATIGKLGILQIAATTNQACCACIPYDGVWNKYLFYYLMARRKAFIKIGEGGAQPNISKEKLLMLSSLSRLWPGRSASSPSWKNSCRSASG